MSPSTELAATLRLGERLTSPWKACAALLAALFGHRSKRRTIHLTPLSAEWLRDHEIDSVKHSNDR